MTEAPQKATVKDTVSQISRALNGGARMILEQPFGSDYIPNKHALDAWNRRTDLPAAVTGWREEILRHLDLSQNHEAGLIPMATQVLLQKIADATTTQPDPVKDAARVLLAKLPEIPEELLAKADDAGRWMASMELVLRALSQQEQSE